MEEFTTTLQVRPLAGDEIGLNDLVVLAGRLHRVVLVSPTALTLCDEDGTLNTFPLDFFGPTWKVAVL